MKILLKRGFSFVFLFVFLQHPNPKARNFFILEKWKGRSESIDWEKREMDVDFFYTWILKFVNFWECSDNSSNVIPFKNSKVWFLYSSFFDWMLLFINLFFEANTFKIYKFTIQDSKSFRR